MGAGALKDIYARTYLFVCNKEEAERILTRDEPQDLKRLLTDMKALGPQIVVITDGRAGAYAYDGERFLKVPLYPDVRPPFERTGAGDAFASTVAVALSLGKPLEEALLWGPVNSMSVVQKIGAREGLITRDTLLKYLSEAPEDYKAEEF